MRFMNTILSKDRWKEFAKSIFSWKWSVEIIMGLEIIGAVTGYWFMTEYEPDSVLTANYKAVQANQEKVREELDRMSTAKEEDMHVLEGMTILMSSLPEQVKLREITIGDFHNGDWIVVEAVSEDRGAMESYLGTLRQNPSFEEMRIADTDNGVRIKVPMPEGFIWH